MRGRAGGPNLNTSPTMGSLFCLLENSMGTQRKIKVSCDSMKAEVEWMARTFEKEFDSCGHTVFILIHSWLHWHSFQQMINSSTQWTWPKMESLFNGHDCATVLWQWNDEWPVKPNVWIPLSKTWHVICDVLYNSPHHSSPAVQCKLAL